jgi:DNA-binding GntR family transcriptional regulator
MKKLKIPSDLTDLTYNSIKQHILEGRFDEDAKLTEASLSEQLGISRSPIREALNSLEKEGLIHIEPRKGAFLKQFSPKEVEDLYNLREVLEAYAVRIAEVTPKLIAALEGSIERSQNYLNENKKLDFMAEDVWFHNSIASASGNQALCKVLENVQNQLRLCRSKTYKLSSSTAPSAHKAIVDALKESDRRFAVKAMRDHIIYVREQLLGSVSERQDLQQRRASEGNGLSRVKVT